MKNSIGIKSIRLKLLKTAAVVGACMALGIGGTTAAFADSTPLLEGSWLYTVTIPAPFVFKGVETYAAGGGYSETISSRSHRDISQPPDTVAGRSPAGGRSCLPI